jgi:hypothetical protein
MALAETSLLQSLLSEGWCLVPSDLALKPTDILKNVGPLLPSRTSSRYYQDLRSYNKASAPQASMSATIGTDAQPMHTDCAYYHLPPHYIALQCLEPGEAYCPTHVWALNLMRLQKSDSAVMRRAQWLSSGGGIAPFYCSILDMQNGIVRTRFDPLCMHPVSGTSHVLVDVRKTLEDCSQQIEFGWKRGNLLIIDNWRCLHARGVGADRAPSRMLRRWLIGARDGLVA